LGVEEDVASKHLQKLAAGGFLIREPISKYLYYSLVQEDALLAAVLPCLILDRESASEQIIRDLTAVTHERRVVIVSLLRAYGPMVKDDLFFQAQISAVAGRRHVNKLVRRGWVSEDERVCRLETAEGMLMSLLMDMID
jgi:hypothetical protein